MTSTWGLDAQGKPDPTGRKDQYNLEMVPNTNKVTGEFTILLPKGEVNRRNRVEGTVETDGSVTLMDPLVYSEDGASASLRTRNGEKYNGKATGQKVDVKWYQYSLSPDLQRQANASPRGEYVKGGDFEIGELTNLRLVSPTAARADFAWRVSLNDFGSIMLSKKEAEGNGVVVFDKKPDETWLVAETKF